MRMAWLLLACVLPWLSACASSPAVGVSPARDASQVDLVEAASVVPGLKQDIRYAGANNFVGAPVTGYEAPKCLLLAPVAQALARVQQDVARDGLSLKVFDCYRPVRAVQHFVRWARDPADQRTKPAYYPNLEKARLLDGYIAETSGHSRGATLDVTLVRCADGDCVELDMGTGFDRFDPLAHTDSPDITARQRDNRRLLLDAMGAEGFANYPMEWWHYTFRPEPTPDTAYDFPVR